jgi:MFS family permease
VGDPTSYTDLSRRRGFRLLIGGRVVSQLGNQLQSLALPLLVIGLTGSSTQAGIVLGLQTAAGLLIGLAAGALADRMDRKRTMIWCELARASLAASVAVAVQTGTLTLAQLYGVAVLSGALGTIFNAANSSAIPSLVSAARLPAALATSSIASNATRIIGAPVAGIAYALGGSIPFLGNAVSFLVSAAALRTIRVRFEQQRTAVRISAVGLIGDITDGLRWISDHAVIRTLALLDAGDSLRFGAGYLLIIVLAQRLHASAFEIGLVFAAAGIGGLLGAGAAPRLARRFRLGHLSILMLWIETAAFPFYALAPAWGLLGLVAFAESVAAPIYGVTLDSYRLGVTPDAMRGRVTAAVDTLTVGAATVGTIASGALIALLGPQAVTYALTGLLAALALTATLSTRLRAA